MSNEQRWEKRFTQLVAFKKKYAHCDVPSHWPEDRCFAHWVSNQRSFRNQKRLLQDRVDRLDQLGFRWHPLLGQAAPMPSLRGRITARDALWNAQFANLVAFKNQQGHCRVGKKDGYAGRLHKWMIRQRVKSRHHQLSPEQRQRLDEIGFDWTGHQLQFSGWEKRFAQLVDFKARFGHCDVHGHWPEDPLFAHWVSNQRSFRNHGKLKPDRIARLEQIGFKWDNRYRRDALIASFQQHLAALDRQWDAKLAELVEYKKQHGHCRVPRHHIPLQQLGAWVIRQRRDARLQRLRPDRRQRLEAIGFDWDIQLIGRERWEVNWAKLIAFKAAHGHCHVPYDYPPDPSLGHWVYTQRRRHKYRQLAPDLCARLAEIGFRWLLPMKPISSASSFHAQLVALNHRWEKQLAEWRQA